MILNRPPTFTKKNPNYNAGRKAHGAEHGNIKLIEVPRSPISANLNWICGLAEMLKNGF